jgi:hypothetical protein
MTRVLDDASLTQTTYYFKFYLFRGMMKAGIADRYLEQLAPWRKMLDLGLTTWAETPDPTRSDSHAWSAHPTVDLLTIVAGIEPASPGFTRVRIRPHLGTLTSLTASLPTPRGDVAVSYRRIAAGLEADVTLPKGVTGSIALTTAPILLHEGKNTVTLR